MASLLEINNVKVEIATRNEPFTALQIEHLTIEKGEMVALVGETGSGKSMTASSIMNLFPTKNAKITSGSIMFDGINLLDLSEKQMESVRGKSISMIFQDPMTSLNPVFRIGDPMVNIIAKHRNLKKQEARKKAIEAFRFVGLPDPEGMMNRYPHELSGGQRQRVMIAMAMACEPKLIIADEPTTALDVTIQSQILYLINEMRRKQGTAVLFITHNLSVVSHIADRIVIMYSGNVVESGKTKDVFQQPQHPYTKMLIDAIPRLHEERESLPVIEGMIDRTLTGCPFSNRCPFAQEKCKVERPLLHASSESHEVACHYPLKEASNHV